MWREQGRDCLFLEMSRSVNHNPHLIIECVPVENDIGETAPIYFKVSFRSVSFSTTDSMLWSELNYKLFDSGFFAIQFFARFGFLRNLNVSHRNIGKISFFFILLVCRGNKMKDIF